MLRSPFSRLVLAIFAVSILIGIAAPHLLRRAISKEEAAEALQRDGRWKDAEVVYWDMLQSEPPTVAHVVGFLDAHVLVEAGLDRKRGHEKDDVDIARELDARGHPRSLISDGAVDAYLHRPDLPPDVALLGQFWRAAHRGVVPPELGSAVHAAAEATPPMPWANRLLGREAEAGEKLEDAVRYLLREGRFVPSHERDVNHALALLVDAEDWQAIGEALADPAIERIASPAIKTRWAVQTNDWKKVARWLVPATYERPGWGPFVLATIAALAWAIFAAQLGHLREKPIFRVLVYAAAFALGTLSVVVTDAFILLEQAKLNLVETGDPGRDLLYFTFGVGFREEISKLLLFLPLLPILRRKGTKVDVLVAGAFVGLGFAAVENLSYLASGDLQTGLGRFLTANFLHMSMTAILASAVDDFAHHGDVHAPKLSKSALLVIALHGAYDFFLSHPQLGGGYAAMGVFFFLANQFLSAVDLARGRTTADERLFRTFMLGIATVCGASYIWASLLVGPGTAAVALAEGLLGMAILIYVFATRLRSM